MADSSHGHTPAAWTGVTIAFIGFCIGSVYLVMAEPFGVIAGMVVVVLGGVVGMIMRSMGMGQPKETAEQLAAREAAGARETAAAAGR
ncbi:HGxxPAAW family protein [Streptomyces alkaliterrae]|uniref:Uncharacterized protein n=1 Tax=Streptomyces alkaliterrae TaxID=2213162 RepID=A0A5P0YMS4_9ACTN|nr:HGxxPAAW family protein [Streptomyces alkaliterrae]MBB1253943.1 hypothetical protein [Streptomyces alkaliterrae]MBB1260075.1 hypothetical protein [Streptomyces alkaliterrae]MQS01220.1 hypothetical protein [Streptomyces alkaliterrae]